MSVEHIVKSHPTYFDACKRGDKCFEVRKDDRGYQKGDILVQQRCKDDRPWEVEWDHFHKPALGERWRAKHELRHCIKWVLTGGQFGIEPGYVVLQLEDIEFAHGDSNDR